MPVVLAFVTIMVEGPAVEVYAMLPFEAMMPVVIIDVVAVVSAPCRIAIVSITGIVSFINAYVYVDLGAGRLKRQRTGDDQGECKQLRFHNTTF